MTSDLRETSRPAKIRIWDPRIGRLKGCCEHALQGRLDLRVRPGWLSLFGTPFDWSVTQLCPSGAGGDV